jgi:membrane magnesium transporter 1
VVGDFREIRATVDLQAKTWETLANIPSFYTFNHRGKSLAPEYLQPSPSSDKMDWNLD